MREGDSQGFIYMAPPSMETPRDPSEWTLQVRSLEAFFMISFIYAEMHQIGTNDTAESLLDERYLSSRAVKYADINFSRSDITLR